MKTIINITLGGRNIAIEDSAYEKIKAYTESLRQYYKNEEGRDEIITDIEGRFSELMNEKMRKGATHITETDVDEMIATMGRPEDFDNTSSAEERAGHDPGFRFGTKRRLYRDESNKVFGGVCSGIANWLNMDPTIVRVLFAIISFGGFGSGFLIYLFLWIFLPAKNMSIYHGKRMYRNPDDKVIGGVAGGMGAYFNINPTTIRWILAIPLILSALKGVHFLGWDNDFDVFPNLFFGGLTGTFIFAYIVLWIVLPEASSPYEKMEMRGATVDVNTIKENVQNSMGEIKERMQSWGQEVKDSAEKLGIKAGTFAQTRGPEFGREFRYAARRNSKGAGYVIAMIFKAFFIFVAGTIAISLFVAFIAFLFSGFAWAPVNNFLWTSDQQQMWAWGTLLFFVGAPIVGLLVWLIRNILNIRTPGNYLNWMFGGLWTVGWVCLTMFIASASRDFKRNETTDTPVNIAQPANGKMILKVSQPELEYKNDFNWMNDGNDLNGFNITPDTLKISAVGIDFAKSADSLFHVIIKKQAFGKTDEDAMNRVKQIHYNVNAVDSVLDFANGFAISKSSKYRFQHVVVQVQVPVGKKIRIDPSLKEKLSDINIHFSDNRNWRRNNWDYKNLSNYRSNVDYTMDSSGSLVSDDNIKDGDTGQEGDNYRWNGPRTDTENAPAAPLAPEAPAPAATPGVIVDTANVYRYDAGPVQQPASNTAEKTKEEMRKELEQKQKELEALKKKLNQ